MVEMQTQYHASQYSLSSIFVTLTYASTHVPTARLEYEYDVDTMEHVYTVSLLNRSWKDKSKNVIEKRISHPNHDPQYILKPFVEGSFKYFTDGHFSVLFYQDVQEYIKKLKQQLFRIYAQKIYNKNHKKLSVFEAQEVRLQAHNFTYLCAGEYGGEHYRSHYHLLFFTDDKRLRKTLFRCASRCWSYGIVDKQYSRGSAASYCSAYLSSTTKLPAIYDMVYKPFVRHSVHYAHPRGQDPFAFLDEEKQIHLCSKHFFTVGNKRKPFCYPQSYTDRLYKKPRGFASYCYKTQYRIFLLISRLVESNPELKCRDFYNHLNSCKLLHQYWRTLLDVRGFDDDNEYLYGVFQRTYYHVRYALRICRRANISYYRYWQLMSQYYAKKEYQQLYSFNRMLETDYYGLESVFVAEEFGNVFAPSDYGSYMSPQTRESRPRGPLNIFVSAFSQQGNLRAIDDCLHRKKPSPVWSENVRRLQQLAADKVKHKKLNPLNKQKHFTNKLYL